jgi:hypothetical protein
MGGMREKRALPAWTEKATSAVASRFFPFAQRAGKMDR